MEIDKTTLADLSIFNGMEEYSVVHKLNNCITSRGRDQLHLALKKPFSKAEDIIGVQQILKYFIEQRSHWPKEITNGTIMVVERFFHANISDVPSHPSKMSTFSYKLFNKHDFLLVRYSVNHCLDFIKGMQQLVTFLSKEKINERLSKELDAAKKIISHAQFDELKNIAKGNKIAGEKILKLGHFIRHQYKYQFFELLTIFGQLDAWYGMAISVVKNNLVFPEIINSNNPSLETTGLYHILLTSPVPYDTELNREANFMFLTGANMAGKSTFIKAIGIAVYLAHIGIGVPATTMKLTVFDGILSNINVIDNIHKGESYFFNEVQRIKDTVTKVSDGKKWLILIDELFKGTNVQDAIKCSLTVIEGLQKKRNSLFILSTHLYEIGESLQKYSNINFNYFETAIANDQLEFNYQLRKGISNDRLGFLILKKEGVVEMLEKL